MYRALTRLKIWVKFYLSLFHALCFLFVLFCGCSSIQSPDDYYKQVLEIEKNRKNSQADVKENSEGLNPINIESVNGSRLSEEQIMRNITREDKPLENNTIFSERQEELLSADIKETSEELTATKKEEAYKESEPPRREPIQGPMPISVSPEVMKIALNSASLEIAVRNIELVNGRLSGGKNSVRINFLSESVDTIDSKFVAICAVIYHLDRENSSIDVIVGMAEDKQSNLLAIFQSDMKDISAWMNNKISPAEWRLRIIKKVL